MRFSQVPRPGPPLGPPPASWCTGPATGSAGRTAAVSVYGGAGRIAPTNAYRSSGRAATMSTLATRRSGGAPDPARPPAASIPACPPRPHETCRALPPTARPGPSSGPSGLHDRSGAGAPIASAGPPPAPCPPRRHSRRDGARGRAHRTAGEFGRRSRSPACRPCPGSPARAGGAMPVRPQWPMPPAIPFAWPPRRVVRSSFDPDVCAVCARPGLAAVSRPLGTRPSHVGVAAPADAVHRPVRRAFPPREAVRPLSDLDLGCDGFRPIGGPAVPATAEPFPRRPVRPNPRPTESLGDPRWCLAAHSSPPPVRPR
ncbi:hypothetical protein CLV72_11434 [Allonocardiopsis opalescens]|uniref:Uncharacterized protein n=1 Tax=Allonocardiopsis opalescens TaxID=1144618 RepID=A0A2T0PS73_9ACTN|nr:hypothetical protein CLV72_11434 [Allonocardiopsis opalescens]